MVMSGPALQQVSALYPRCSGQGEEECAGGWAWHLRMALSCGMLRLNLRRQVPLKEHFGHCSRIAGLAWAGPDRLVTAGAGSKLGC